VSSERQCASVNIEAKCQSRSTRDDWSITNKHTTSTTITITTSGSSVIVIVIVIIIININGDIE